jgi:hypothetical protein
MARRSTGNSRLWRAVIQIAVSLILALIGKKFRKPTTVSKPPRRSRGKRASSPATTTSEIADLFARRQSDTIVTGEGLIVKILPDDLHDDDGSGKHQQFLVDVAGDVTIKIAHNLKFGRAPVREGDTIRFKGEYEWNDRGGCIHWTHHDPKGWRDGGWLEIRGKRYG